LVITEWPLTESADSPAAVLTPPARAESRLAQAATEWVLFTSGTTGRPKMVVHTLDSLAGHISAPGTGSGPVWCTFYDIRRYGGLQVALRALLGGGSLVLSCPMRRRPRSLHAQRLLAPRIFSARPRTGAALS
jgi:acyl-CoA synthetase (AMP-forming)/AMP-acid ligase II